MQRIEAVLRSARGTGALAITTILIVAFGCVQAAAAKSPLGSVHGSAEQVYTTGATPHARLTLVDKHGRAIQTSRVDPLGALLFRNVAPDKGYRLRGLTSNHRTIASKPISVFSERSAPPSTRIYRQRIPAKGYGYLTTRDGIKLAIDVRLPSGGKGPFPTLIEYAGYGYADPFHGPDSGIAQIANLLGFAVVDVNMRGTGCSGGAYDFFEPLQSLDGYDVIETVARQPWVLHHKVGMMGISFGGISQLFVGQTNPPSLAAITPLSVIDATATTLYPGGILNTGFAVPWSMDRVHDAEPASATGGQPWALQEINAGDKTCKANQALHDEAADLLAKIRANRFYVPAVADPLSPITFVNKIKAPVFLACQLTDEQTGPHCPALAAHFTGTSRRWFTFENGMHTDSLDPATFNRWFDFLELFVARQRPSLPPLIRAGAGTLYHAVLGVNGVTLPDDPIQAQPSYAAALSAFERLPRVRVLFDNGAGSATPGNPVAAYEHSFSALPVPGTQAKSLFLGAGGTLNATPPASGGTNSFTPNKTARPATDFTGPDGGGPGGLWNALPPYNWTENPRGTALSYTTPPLSANTTVVGAGALHAWLRASSRDVDVQATITEVRPDGKETYVQSGWLRASMRKLDPSRSTVLEPQPSFRFGDSAPLPAGRFTDVTIPLYYEAHAYRAGSRIRVTLSAPGGDQPVWAFKNTVPGGHPTVSVAFSKRMPSRLILPVVPGLSIPSPLPPCPALRGEPCRTYVPSSTGG